MEQTAYTPDENLNDPWSRTAIERQLAAAAALGYGTQSQQGAPKVPPDGRFVPSYDTELNKLNRFGFWSFLLLCVLVVVGVGLIFNYVGGPLHATMPQFAQFTRSHDVLSAPNSSVANNSSQVKNNSPAVISSQEANSLPTKNSSVIDNSSQATNTLPANNSVPANAPTANVATPSSASENTSQIIVSKSNPEVSTIPALSVPISDVSLRNRPELLEQLVQVYKTQFTKDPNNATALAALSQLQDQSLSELQVIIAQGDPAVTVKAVATISRIFPELADNTRYKYLIARMDYNQRVQKDESIAKTEASTTSAAVKPVVAAPAAIASSPTSPVAKSADIKSVTTSSAAPIKEVSSTVVPSSIAPSTNVSSSASKKNTESTASSKPEIRSVSIVPGAMVDDNFVPRDGGNVFMVEINYRNFEKVFEGNPAATLTTLLGTPDDSMVLAEVPIIITADRGTKSFLMETEAAQGYAGGKFELSFMLNDEFLTSRTLRLSKPGR